MSLDWNLSKIANHETLCWMVSDADESGATSRMAPRTEALIWSCMAVGLSGITDTNLLTFFTRLYAYERLFGPMCANTPCTLPDLAAHTGLTTNVSNESDTRFWKRMQKHVERETRAMYSRWTSTREA